MANIINIVTFEIVYSANTPDYTKAGKIHFDGGNWRELHKLLALPMCDKKYWKWDGSAVVEMTTQEKADEDYIPPTPEPTPPTVEEVEKTRKRDIADGIAEKYTLADENAMMRKLHTGESLLGDADIQDWLNWVASKKSEHPKV